MRSCSNVNSQWVSFLGMIRTMHSFSIIHIFLAIITFMFGLYSIHDYRYTYKRLTGMIYILTGNEDNVDKFMLTNDNQHNSMGTHLSMFLAASLVVCIEALNTIVRHSNVHLPDRYPLGTIYSYGSCYIIAWLIFVQLVVSSLIFFVCSRKRKGTFDEVTDEEALANGPVDLGRSF
jgi:hypothetical protein